METQRYETCRALADGVAWIDQGDAEKAHGRFQHARESAEAFTNNYPNNGEAKALLKAASVLADTPTRSLDSALAPQDLALVERSIAICNGLKPPG